MAGGKGPLRRRAGAAKSVEAAATGSSTKGKASGKKAVSCQTRPRGSGRKTKEETAAAAETEEVAVKRRLPAKDIWWILAQKPRAPQPAYEALKRSNPELVPRGGEEDDEDLKARYVLARAFYEMEERLAKFQYWVHGEVYDKGYVEVDDDWFKRMEDPEDSEEEVEEVVDDREWPGIGGMMQELRLSKGVGDESESDSSDEEEGADE